MERTLLMGYLTSIRGSFCNCNRGMDFWSSGDIVKTELRNFHISSPTLSWKSACNFVLKSGIVWPYPGHLTRLSFGKSDLISFVSRRKERGTDSSFRSGRRKRGQTFKDREKLVSHHVWCEIILMFSLSSFCLFLFLFKCVRVFL